MYKLSCANSLAIRARLFFATFDEIRADYIFNKRFNQCGTETRKYVVGSSMWLSLFNHYRKRRKSLYATTRDLILAPS